METFMKFQAEETEKINKQEEERWKRETEIEERRRKEDRQHDIQMMQMLGQTLQPRPYIPTTVI